MGEMYSRHYIYNHWMTSQKAFFLCAACAEILATTSEPVHMLQWCMKRCQLWSGLGVTNTSLSLLVVHLVHLNVSFVCTRSPAAVRLVPALARK